MIFKSTRYNQFIDRHQPVGISISAEIAATPARAHLPSSDSPKTNSQTHHLLFIDNLVVEYRLCIDV